VSAVPAVSAPGAPTASPLLRAATDTLKLVVGMANTPGGLSLATTLIGASNPAILLVEQFGVRVLGPLLVTWTGADCTDEDVMAKLAASGHKVVPFDPMKEFAS
jgi:hypothetical protein